MLYQPGEIGGLVTRVANGTLPLASMLPVPGSRRDADQQHQRDDDSRQQAETDSRGDVPKLTHETGKSIAPRIRARAAHSPDGDGRGAFVVSGHGAGVKAGVS